MSTSESEGAADDAAAPTNREESVDTKVISLGADLGIEHAQSLHAMLKPHLSDDAPVRIDGSAVERVHAAALQLLCVFNRDRVAAGKSVEFVKSSETLRSAVAVIGAANQLSLA